MRYFLKHSLLMPTAALCVMGAMAAAAARVEPRLEAVTGGRFGVGRITFGLTPQMQPAVLGGEALCLEDKDGRVLYPAIKPPPLGGLFADLFGRPHPITIYFLFRGDGPLELTIRGRTARTVTLTPRRDPVANRRLLESWWQQYTAPPKLLQGRPDYPPLVDNYLKSMLARRLSLKLPGKEQTESWQDRLAEEVGLMLGTESIRLAMQQDRILGLNHLDQAADRPLPAPIVPAAVELPPPPKDVEIEPIAWRVPAECFYVRFGSFGNFLWMQDTMARWRGDLQNLLATRGLDYGENQRIQRQLVLKQTAISRLLGPTVVADVALIGTDMFFREGAAYGLLFYARQGTLLGTNISAERAARLKGGGVAETKLNIAGKEVSLLASPDGAVRSYYAADGDFHFVTTSKTLARRFLETAPGNGKGSGKGPLGGSSDFRHARAVMPVDRRDTVFVYFSDAFFRNLTGPHYRVEIARRLQAASDVDLVQLAVLASATEGKPGGTIEELVSGELLPPEFAARPDGSRTVLKDGLVYDQLRGHRGGFLPVPDTPLKAVTAAEESAYRRFADFYRQDWGRLDPVMIGVKRAALADDRERVTIDVRISPVAVEHFELLSRWAGPAKKVQLAPIKGDVVAGELVLRDQHLFGGLADFGLPLQIGRGGSISFIGLRDAVVGYIGTTGRIGLLGLLDAQILNPPNARGYSSNRLGLWRRQFDGFTVFSLHPEILSAVTPQLKFQPAPRAAQLRLSIGDLSQARITPTINGLGYTQTRETSLGNLRLLAKLAQQLGLPPEDCLQAAEFLLDAKLVCPLGGQYVFRKNPQGSGWWTSTALMPAAGLPLLGTQPPDGYRTPPLDWFRGLDLDAAMTQDAISVHAELIIHKAATAQ